MASPQPKRCLYEVLGLSRDCSPDEIRSAYRKMALQRHPDKLVKTGVSEADATAQFQELVNAYEVLSDARERAWYDSHRSQILFADAKSSSSSSSVIVPDLFSFFSNSAFSGFSDSRKGFYKVYGDVFDRVYQSEVTFTKKMGLALPKEAPLMGNSECHYAQVTAFYNHWLGFTTVMDFCWVDQYDVMAGQDRKSRRMMEDENKKLRKKACREYNETVRGLAGFVKKRDKRVIAMQRKKAEEMEKKKAEEQAKKKELERLKAERARQYEEPDWAKVDEFEDDDEEVVEETGKKGNLQELYCVACGKKFKSDKQWKNHEQSKKHKERVAELKDAFEEEDEEFEELKADDSESSFVSADDEDRVVDDLREDFADTVEIPEEDDELRPSEKIGSGVDANANSKKGVRPAMGSEDNEESILEDMISGYKSQKPKKKEQVEIDSDEVDFMEYNNVKGSRKNKGRRKQRGQVQDEEASQPAQSVPTENNESGDSTPETVRPDPSNANGQPENTGSDDSKPEASAESISKRDKSEKNRKISKPGADKRRSGKQDNNSKSKEEPTKGRKKKGNARASGNGCDTCGEEFESRNKLHRHLGETGHASLKSK